MKKILVFVTLITLAGILLISTRAMASPAVAVIPHHTPDHTPGAQATAKALQGNPGNKEGGNPHGKQANYRGTISAVNATGLDLTLADGSSVSFVLNADTRIKIPTLGKLASVADLKAGMKVNVHSEQDAAKTLTAKIVLVVPGKPTLMHRVGEVTAYHPGVSINIKGTDGILYTYLVTEKTKILPAGRIDLLIVGARVTVIMPRDVTGGTPTASGIVVHPAH